MDDVKQALFKRIAHMSALEVPQNQIANAIGLSPERVSQLLQHEEVMRLRAEFAAERIERFNDLNDGWDLAEETALGTVLTALQQNPDADFALRVAQMANKAHRRGTLHNRPIEAGNGANAAQAVIHLHQHFVERLESNHGVNMQPVNRDTAIEGKVESALSPGDVTRLLSGKPTEAEEGMGRLQSTLAELFQPAATPVAEPVS